MIVLLLYLLCCTDRNHLRPLPSCHREFVIQLQRDVCVCLQGRVEHLAALYLQLDRGVREVASNAFIYPCPFPVATGASVRGVDYLLRLGVNWNGHPSLGSQFTPVPISPYNSIALFCCR